MQPAVYLIWLLYVTFWVASRGFTGFQGSLLYTRSVISWSLRIKRFAITNHCGFLHPLLPPSFALGPLFALFPLIVSVWQCWLAGTLLGGSRIPGLPWIPPLQLGIWHPANLLGISSQAHLFVMSLIHIKSDSFVFVFYHSVIFNIT